MSNERTKVKLCKGPCGKVKPLTDFYDHPTTKDRKQGKCIECHQDYQTQYNLKKKPRIRKYRREYYAENKEKISEYYRDWYKRNKRFKRQQNKDNTAKRVNFDQFPFKDVSSLSESEDD